MDAVEIFRVATLLGAGVTLGYFAGFIHAYLHKVVPLRRRTSLTVIAPPVRWSLAYHLLYASIVTTIAVTSAHRLYQGESPTVQTWVMPVLMVASVVVIRQFYLYYVRDLERVIDQDARGRG